MTRIRWSQEESELLKRVYSIKTSNELAEIFPQYTNTQILRRAKRLGLKKKKEVSYKSRLSNSIIARQDLWTDEEKAIIIEHYPVVGAKGVQELLPNRPIDSIKRIANRMGIKRIEANTLHWEQVEVSIQNTPNHSITIKYKGK